jgi:hypothetical protein
MRVGEDFGFRAKTALLEVGLTDVESLSTEAALPRDASPFLHQFIDQAPLQRDSDILAKTTRATEFVRLLLELCVSFHHPCLRNYNSTVSPMLV